MKRISTNGLLVGAALAVALSACSGEPKFSEPMVLGGQEVSAETLNLGHDAYIRYCRQCHGQDGDGRGPAGLALRPPPRDFRQGYFKFGAVSSGELPHDEDLVRIVRNGLLGTAMLPWDIPQKELLAIIQYIKTFHFEDKPSRWAEKTPGKKVLPTPDPWGLAKHDEAVERGNKLYHGLAECWSCHAAYATKKDIYEAYVELRGSGSTDFRKGMYEPELKDSQYKIGEQAVNIMPPDFLVDPIKSGNTYSDLYRTVAAGIGGTAMPAWKESLPEADIWAIVHYVKSIADLRDTPAAHALQKRLRTQGDFVAPKKKVAAPKVKDAAEADGATGAAAAPAGRPSA